MLNSLYIGNRDGGIINSVMQAPQTGDPFVIIGLGGTGVDAISCLKEKMRKRIEPDNVYQVMTEGEEPEYQHIKFLGIDTDPASLEYSCLDPEEIFHINSVNVPFSRHLDGTGADREFGRWLTVSKADEIKRKIHQIVIQATQGVTRNALTVHIVSGISGGMGGGSFADVCYITRNVLEELGIYGANILGYFVLPDVNCSKNGVMYSFPQMKNIQKNGIASLLEIEHLMNLKDSNEWFEQDYNSEFRIRTQHQLVDMCYLISAADSTGQPINDAYEYALNVIGDYILAFVSMENLVADASGISMMGHLANVTAHLATINPAHDQGYSQNYHLLGEVSAKIPVTQMGTYLATKLFKNLTIQTSIPNEKQIRTEFADYLCLTDERFDAYENMIEKETFWLPIDEKEVEQYFNQIRSNKDDSIILQKTKISLLQRKQAMINNRIIAEKPIDDYAHLYAEDSIPKRALNKLIEMIEDPKKGPIYAYGMMNRNGSDIFSYLNWAKTYYLSKIKEACKQREESFAKKSEIQESFATVNFINKKFKIKEYTDVLNEIYMWQAKIDLYEQIEILLDHLIIAFHKINDEYLIPLYRMIIELLETFENNDSYFSMGYGDRSQDGFTKQLISFSQLQPMLDDAIGKIDPLIETKNLLRVFTQNSEIWMKKQELKLKGVISYYVLDKFESIFSQSLESFLRKNLHMENAPAQIFANAIQHQIIAPLVASAAPIFWTSEPMVQNRLETAHRSILTVPNAANCICQAADNYKGADVTIDIRKSLINDRISVLKTISGVPMHAYQGLLVYFDIYDKGEKQRIHSYEGNSNWRENLTFPCPYSYLPQYTKNAEELLELYKRAEKMGIIYYDGSQAYVKRSVEVPKEALEIDSLIKNGKLDKVKANDRIQELQELLTKMLEPLRINSKGNSSKNNPNNPDPADHANTLVKDNFLRFYGIQQAVKAEVEKYDQIHHTLESIEQIKEKEKLRKIFFDAVVAEMFEADEISKHYLEFQKVWESDLAKRQEFCQKTNVKFNEILIKEKLNRVEQLSSMYATESIEKVSKKEEFEDMENFCLAFKDYLSQMQLMLNMVDLT